ncbi:MAG: winged helix-turn-helix domain-containing protein [Acidobacteriota bacterium]
MPLPSVGPESRLHALARLEDAAADGSAQSARRVRFGPFELDLELGRLTEGGELVPLQPLRAKALELLVRRAGEPVSRAELISALWGDTRVDYDQSLRPIIRTLRHTLGDCAREPRYLATVRGVGYRFIGDVVPARSPAWGTRPWWLAAAPALGLGLLLVLSLAWFPVQSSPAFGGRVRVAALPASGDLASRLFSLDLALDLERRYGESVEVVSHAPLASTAEALETSSAPSDELERLRVDYLVTGRLEPVDDRTLVVSELLDPDSRRVVSAWRRRVPQSELSRVTPRLNDYHFVDLVGSKPALARSTQRDAERTLYLSALAHLPLGGALDYRKAVHLAEALVDLQPDSPEALGLLALAHYDLWMAELGEASACEGIFAARRALDLDPWEPRALTAMAAFSFFVERDHAAAREFLARALERTPDEPRLWILVMDVQLALGRPDDARFAALQAAHLAPLAPQIGIEVGWTLYATGAWDHALEHSQRLLDRCPECVGPRLVRLHIFQHREQWRQLGREMQSYLEQHRVALDEATRLSAAATVDHDPTPFWRHRTAYLLELRQHTSIYPEYLALSFAAAGDGEAAVAWLRRSWMEKTPSAATVLRFPLFDPIRHRPDFEALQAEVNRTLRPERPLSLPRR